MNNHIIHRSLEVFTNPSKPVSRLLRWHYAKKYHGKYRFARTLFVIDFFLLAFVVALGLTAIVLSTELPKAPERVAVKIVATPAEVRSGDRMTLTVSYQNKEHKSLGPVALVGIFPVSFELKDAPAGWSHIAHAIDLGALEAGARGELVFQGVLRAPVGSVARFYFQTRIGNEVRTEELALPVRFSALNATISAPPRMVDGEEATITLELNNVGSENLHEVVVRPKFPPGVIVASSTPALVDGVWSDFGFVPGATKQFVAVISAQNRPGDVPIGFEVALREGGALIPQGLAVVAVKHVQTGLVVQTAMDSQAPLRFDDKQRTLTITVKNMSEKKFRDAKVRLSLGALPVEIQTSEWEIGDLNAGETKTLTAAFQLKTPGADERPPFVVAPVVTVEGTIDGVEGKVLTTTHSSVLPIATVLQATVSASYYSSTGEQIGRGPYPPRVGAKTTFWVAVTLKNRGNAIKDFTLRGWLPLNVRWIDRFTSTLPEGSSVAYDSVTRRVVVRVGELPAEGEWTIVFAADLTPARADIGKAPWLFLPETVSGHETMVNVPLDLRLGEPVTAVATVVK